MLYLSDYRIETPRRNAETRDSLLVAMYRDQVEALQARVHALESEIFRMHLQAALNCEAERRVVLLPAESVV